MNKFQIHTSAVTVLPLLLGEFAHDLAKCIFFILQVKPCQICFKPHFRLIYTLIILFQGIVLVYDVTTEDSFKHIAQWLQNIQDVSTAVIFAFVVYKRHCIYNARQFAGKCKKPAVFKTQNSIKERPRCNISSVRCSVLSQDETPRRELKVQLTVEYF